MRGEIMKRTIEIEDNLKELVDTCKQETLEAIKDWLQENRQTVDIYDFVDDNGIISEIVDSNTPIYYYDCKCLMFLYENEFAAAYKNIFGKDMPKDGIDKYNQLCIYCYLDQETHEFISQVNEAYMDWIKNTRNNLAVIELSDNDINEVFELFKVITNN
jgi:hypothetical protein